MKMPEMPALSPQLAALTQDDSELRALIYGHAVAYGEAVREACAKLAESFATCPCKGGRGRCMENDPPLAVAAAIRKDTP
jgi:hypothetical protein